VAADLLILTCGVDDNVVRLLPPLTIDDSELLHGVDLLEQCIRDEVDR
jgi:4-aminobutyrate aminotransferase-like enzyme